MQKETIGLPEQLFFLVVFFFSFSFFLTALFLVTRGKKLAGDGWWLMGEGSQTKLRSEKKVNPIEMISTLCQLFGLLYAMKQHYILNLTNVWLYFMGRGNMATAAFFRDLRA